MDKLHSKSLSKSILLATPLFVCILALLNSSDELSYLFVLNFLGNVAGRADLTFMSAAQPEGKGDLEREFIMRVRNISAETMRFELPLVNISELEQWAINNDNIVRGVAPRWLVPVKVAQFDGLVMISNIAKQLSIGIGLSSGLGTLSQNEVALTAQSLRLFGKKIGDKVTIKLSLRTLLAGSKMMEKYQQFQSKQEYVVQDKELTIDQLVDFIYNAYLARPGGTSSSHNITKEEIRVRVEQMYELQYEMAFTVAYEYKGTGLYPSSFHNVVMMQYAGITKLMSELIIETVIDNKQLQNELFELARMYFEQKQAEQIISSVKLAILTNTYKPILKRQILKLFQEYPLLAIASFNRRQLIYNPSRTLHQEMSTALQRTPGSVDVISVYPFYDDLDNIRYFFKSVIQIFEFVCVVLYFYTMRMIVKQVYDQKEIQVGIWRTLGVGGVPLKAINVSNEHNINPRYQLPKLKQQLTWRQKLVYTYRIIVTIGFFYYWVCSAITSIILYIFIKAIIYKVVCELMDYNVISQSYVLPVVLFVLVLGFTLGLSIGHIQKIYMMPLVETIKPIKRTFDLVKIRVIRMATFGISAQMLIIAIMLVSYGVISYYLLPQAILTGDSELQTTLFNSIFIGMIVGGIILLVILQSRGQRLILRCLFLLSSTLRKLKLLMLKNIRAQQYKNIKVSIIFAMIFAFLLYFTAGINIEIRIVESFIQRQLGAQLVIENYQNKGLNRTEIQSYLDSVGELKYSWVSNNLNRNKTQTQLISMISNNRINANIKILTDGYLNSTYYDFYYPEEYIKADMDTYTRLPNGVYDGFCSIYDQNGNSKGKYNENDTLTLTDPYQINILKNNSNEVSDSLLMAPQEQVIDLVVTSALKKNLGASAGDTYKLMISNTYSELRYAIRARITHSLKIGPGLDLFRPQAYISEQQAKYIYNILNVSQDFLHYQKLFVTGPLSKLQEVGNHIVAISPQQTQLFEMNLVSQSFELLQRYLLGFITFITIIMGCLAVLFLAVYTVGKCRDEADMYKMLRAIGMPVRSIRIMVFIDILVRLVVSIFNGILLGILFALGLSMQIEEFLMIKTPAIDLSTIMIIGAIMILVFSFTVVRSTSYLGKRTVQQTNKL